MAAYRPCTWRCAPIKRGDGMRNYKGNMLLIELVIVILFFSLSQVVLVQVFSGAQAVTRNSERLNQATLKVQDLAEQLVHASDPEASLAAFGFTAQSDDLYTMAFGLGTELSAKIERTTETFGVTIRVDLSAWYNEKEIFSLPAVNYFPLELALEVQHEQ